MPGSAWTHFDIVDLLLIGTINALLAMLIVELGEERRRRKRKD